MVPRAQAREGFTFKALVDPRCFKCSFYSACAGALRAGGRYRVVGVRRTSHLCPIIGYEMVVVEVEEEPIPAAVESRVALEGVALRYSKVKCDTPCPYRDYCTRTPLLEGERVRVVRVRGRIPCPRSLPLMLVELLPLH